MGLLLQLFHLQLLDQTQFKKWTPGQGCLIVRPVSEWGFLLMSNAGDSRTETPRLG